MRRDRPYKGRLDREGARPDLGPSILNAKDDEQYYVNHKQAVNAAWAEFKLAVFDIVDQLHLVDIESIENNADLFAATANIPNIQKGKDLSAAGTYLWPDKLNYVDLRNPATVEKVAGIVIADIYVALNYKAEYFLDKTSTGSVARMRIIAEIRSIDSRGKYLRSTTLTGISDETVAFIENSIDPTSYPSLIVSAQKNLLPKIAEAIGSW